MSSSANESYPLVVYLPNAPAPVENPFLTNTSTFTLSYSYEEVEAFLDSANLNAKKGFPNPDSPLTPDSEFALALKCATVDRARQRAGIARSSACQNAFNRCECRFPYSFFKPPLFSFLTDVASDFCESRLLGRRNRRSPSQRDPDRSEQCAPIDFGVVSRRFSLPDPPRCSLRSRSRDLCLIATS